ncbi:MAG: heme ABC transporter permease CcmC [Rhodobacteraceae bacterium]|nr:heme ABC transporter permease CcmC [Paracoccaceae bacterium]
MKSLWELSNPRRFVGIADRWLVPLSILTAILVVPGLIWGFAFTPDDHVQGSTVKIMFIHVPAALTAINGWLMMLVASIIWLVRRHRVSALAARAAAPVGLAMTFIALATGALWGQQTWGTYWAWEPRLTSFLILFLHYAAYVILWNSLGNSDAVAEIAAYLCLVGSVFALLSRYAVLFWEKGLHQGSTLSLDPETHIHAAFYWPLLLCMAGFTLLFVTLVVLRTRTFIEQAKIASRFTESGTP